MYSITLKIRWFLFNVILLIGIVPIQGLKAQDDANSSLALGDVTIIDASRGELFLTTPDRNVEAVAMNTGEVLWQSGIFIKPLAIKENRLICQAWSKSSSEGLVIVMLDVTKQGDIMIKDSTVLDKEVKANFVQHPNSTFKLTAKVVGDQTFFRYDFEQNQYRGIREEDKKNLDDTLVKQSGALALNLTTGKLKPIAETLLPEKMSTSIKPTKPLKTKDAKGQQFMSVDKKHILISRKILNDTTFNRFIWEIYDAATQQKIGELNNYLSYSPFYVRDMKLFYQTGPYVKRLSNNQVQQQPLTINAVDLKSGALIWSKPILDTVYRGPTPP